MLAAAKKYSDFVVVTSDNPRTGSPQSIIDEILGGVAPGKQIHVEVDRKTAIAFALARAKPKDIVLIAGKGHENFQFIGTTQYPFDDVLITKEILGEKR